MVTDRTQEIVNLAKDIYESIKPSVGLNTFMISYNSFETIELLLPFHNIYLEEKEFRVDSFCGFLMIDELENTLVVNRKHESYRKLFTMGHELGHFFLHKHLQSAFFEKGLSDKLYSFSDLILEREANLFASELLVPCEVLEKMLSMKFNFFRISKTIGVSKTALKWRIQRFLMDKFSIHSYFADLLINDYATKSLERIVEESYLFFMDTNIHLQREIFAELKGEESVFYIYKEIALEKQKEAPVKLY